MKPVHDSHRRSRNRAIRNATQSQRHDSIMERRVRARAEGFDNYDDESDSHMDHVYVPNYRNTSGGCATGALYLLLTVVVISVVMVIVGPRILMSFVPNVPEKLEQIVVTPTPTIRDRGGTIQQIRSLNRLETKSFTGDRIIEARVERGNALDLLLGDRLILIASGTVVAGVDLSKLTTADVVISSDGEQITLRLPPSEIFARTLDNGRTRVYDRQKGILAPSNKDLETQARQQAEAEILNAACAGGIMQQAASEAQRSLEQMLRLLGFTSVTVTSSAGPCIAPVTAPYAEPTSTP